jgi:hypothetical protein
MMNIYDNFRCRRFRHRDVEFTGELGFEKFFFVRIRIAGSIVAAGVLRIAPAASSASSFVTARNR